MRIGLVGAAGRLGGLIADALNDAGAIVIAVEVERSSGFARTPLGDLDALIVTAPLSDVRIHRQALAHGCHVLDVTVGAELNQALLGLDELATTHGRSVIAMAGLAPGLTGALALDVLDAAANRHARAVLALLQHPLGSAGRQGTRDMLDLLTAPEVRYRPRPVYSAEGNFAEVRLFDLLNFEPQVMGMHERLELTTGWSSGPLDTAARALRLLRRISPRLFAGVRDLIADRKAAASSGADEAITLSAVAIDEVGRPLNGRQVRLASDYGATAAITAATAIAAVRGETSPAAGHLAMFLKADRILADPLMQPHLADDMRGASHGR